MGLSHFAASKTESPAMVLAAKNPKRQASGATPQKPEVGTGQETDQG